MFIRTFLCSYSMLTLIILLHNIRHPSQFSHSLLWEDEDNFFELGKRLLETGQSSLKPSERCRFASGVLISGICEIVPLM